MIQVSLSLPLVPTLLDSLDSTNFILGRFDLLLPLFRSDVSEGELRRSSLVLWGLVSFLAGELRRSYALFLSSLLVRVFSSFLASASFSLCFLFLLSPVLVV